MAQISLHDYLQQIDTLLEENRLSEAIAHCRHILGKFSRYVDAYRLYGKALLEQQKFDDAADIFRRVLSADPEDFISHVGLAITHKEKGKIPEAIWHFERAFEMDPYNAAIQEELRGLYAHRDGLRPERITLTRGALARLYFRGNLYHQAAAELRQILSKSGERLDLQTLLAETLWRDDQRVDVVDVCLRILDKTPYSIKANAILAEVWLVTGRSDEAHEYLQRLRMLTRPEKSHLDPDSVVGRAFNANGVMELPDEVLIEELDYFPAAQELSGAADWVTELGIQPEEDEEATWLDEIEKVGASVFAEAAASDEDMLDWLREVAVSEGEAEDEGDVLDELDDGAEAAEAAEAALGEMPDWLSEVTASAEAEMWNSAIEESEAEPEVAEEASNVLAAVENPDVPEWIREASQDDTDMAPVTTWNKEDFEGASWDTIDEEVPDWMRGEGGTDEFPDWLSESGDATRDEGEVPDWLNGSETEPKEAFPEFSVEEGVYGVTGEELPSWLVSGEDETAAETEAGAEMESGSEDSFDADFDAIFESGSGFEAEFGGQSDAAVTETEDLPDWLSEGTGVSEGVAADVETDDDLLDWLDGGTGLDSSDEVPTLVGATETETDDGELPDWLNDLPAAEAAEIDDDEDLSWLNVGDSADADDDEDLPDWLSDGSLDVTDSSETEVDDAPSWLSEITLDDSAETDDDDEDFDWLRAAATFDGSADEEMEDEDAPDWLSDGPSGEGLSSERLFAEGALDTADSGETDGGEELDWLSAMPALEDSADEETEDEDLPEWLSEGLAEAADASDMASGDDSYASWLSAMPALEGLADEEIDEGPPTWVGETPEAATDDSADLEADDEALSEWLANLPELEDDAGATNEALPEWLSKAQEMELIGEKEEDNLGDIPDWLQGEEVASEEAAVAAEADFTFDLDELEDIDETADWLHVIDEAEQTGEGLLEEGLLAEGLLDEGSAEERSEEELPDWVEESPELIMGQTDIDQDSLPDWLDGGDQEDMVREDTLMGSSEEQDNKAPEIPEDLDEAMKWLEELAAQQGADLEELPSLRGQQPAKEATAVEGDEVPDWLKADLSDGGLSAGDDLPAWLQNEADPGSDWANLSSEDELSEMEIADFDFEDSGVGAAEPSEDDIPDWLKAQMPEDLQTGTGELESEGDLGWLDQIAAGEGAPIDELPTLSWDDKDNAELEDSDLTWLDEMVADSEGVPEIEEPISAGVSGETAEAVGLQVPDDPDEAMAWLERLAAQQGAPLDELPTVADEVPTPSEEVSLADIMDVSDVDPDAPTVFDTPDEMEFDTVAELGAPEDPDEAMAWLEQLAANQGARLEELPTVTGRADLAKAAEMGVSEMPTMMELPEEMEEITAEAEAEIDIPDDPDEAMAWLEQLAARQGASLDELPTVNVAPEMPTPVTDIMMEAEAVEATFEAAVEAEPEVDAELEMALADLSDIDMPEDDDEALAWLAAIMGSEEAEAPEATFEEAAEAFIDAPPDFFEQLVEEEFEPISDSDLFAPLESEPVAFEDMDEPLTEESLFDDVEMGTEQFIELEGDLPVDMDEDGDLAATLPDWLQFGPVGDTSREELDWLDTFGDSDVDSWLEAEEQISQIGLSPAVSEPEPISFAEPELESEPELEVAAELEDYAEATFEAESIPTGPIDENQLESARSALEIGDFDTAVSKYNSLLQSGEGLPMLIADLENASTRHTHFAPLQRLLGDAYMQNGQLQKAIDIYRQALDNL